MICARARKLLLSFDTGELMISLVGLYVGLALLSSVTQDGQIVPFLYKALSYRFAWLPVTWGVFALCGGCATLWGIWCNIKCSGHCYAFRWRSMLWNFVVWFGVCLCFNHSGEFFERGMLYAIFCSISLLKYWRLKAKKRDFDDREAIGERRCAIV